MPDVVLGPSKHKLKKDLLNKLKSQPVAGTRTAFREAEKKYLTRNPPPDYSDVVDFTTLSPVKLHDDDQLSEILGLRSGDLSVYTLDAHPGAVFIPAALSPSKQRELIRECLRDTTKAPNQSNLDTHYVLPKEGLWYHYERSRKGEDILVQPVESTSDRNDGPRELISNAPLTADVDPATLTSRKAPAQASSTSKPELASKLMYRLRWTNLGLMYHWASKSYHFDRVLLDKEVPKVPQTISDICRHILRAVPAHLRSNEDWDRYNPESGIINFYQLKDTLMGHIDQSELVDDKPLVSISLGQTAVFLIGGVTRDVEPTAVYLRSGDILIMSGPSRRVFHGVPRVVENSLPEYLRHGEDWDSYAEYLATTRININVRQVFPEGYLDRTCSGQNET